MHGYVANQLQRTRTHALRIALQHIPIAHIGCGGTGNAYGMPSMRVLLRGENIINLPNQAHVI